MDGEGIMDSYAICLHYIFYIQDMVHLHSIHFFLIKHTHHYDKDT